MVALSIVGSITLAIAIWFFAFIQPPTEATPSPNAPGARDTGRFSPERPVTKSDLETLRWDEVNQLLQAVADEEIERLIRLSGDVNTPPATYLRGLLLILQREPELSLAAFGSLDPQAIPPSFLYAPHRLQQTLHPDGTDAYLVALRKATAEGKVPPLIGARVRALDGELTEALHSYLQTDPGRWAAYDLDSLQRIATHQGLATDLRKLIAGALSSGRVKPTLVAPLQELARQGAVTPEPEEFKRQIRREIEANTPAGRIAIESAKKLINDRKLFLTKKYTELIGAHRDADPIKLPTETVLLLFFSAVELREQIEMDRWGQELKRRHRDVEVRDWVNETMSSAR